MDRTTMMDINKIGPGIWFKIHMDAVAAKTKVLKESFVVNINILCDGFKCKHCQPHFRKYIDNNPIEKYFDIKNEKGVDVGIFQWAWEFHNAVNYRLGKYQPLLKEAYEYYTNNTVGACHSCGQNKDINIKNDTKTPIIVTSDIINSKNSTNTKNITNSKNIILNDNNKIINIKNDNNKIININNNNNKIININNDNNKIINNNDNNNKIINDNDASMRFKPHKFKSNKEQTPNFPFKIYTR